MSGEGTLDQSGIGGTLPEEVAASSESYEAPDFVVLGTVAELTRGSTGGPPDLTVTGSQ